MHAAPKLRASRLVDRRLLGMNQGKQDWEKEMTEQQKKRLSRVCKVVKEGDSGSGFEARYVDGEHMLPTRSGEGEHWGAMHGATHSHPHTEAAAISCRDTSWTGARHSR